MAMAVRRAAAATRSMPLAALGPRPDWSQPGFHTVKFNAPRHLVLEKPVVHTLASLGYASTGAVSPLACTAPFQLLSDECVQLMRQELEDERLKRHCTFGAFGVADEVVRGITHYSKFFFDFCQSERLQQHISQLLSMPVRPHPMQYERAHINLQRGDQGAAPVFAWHKDSQPFVLITMLSDPPEDASGGATLIRRADGSEQALDFTKAGQAYLLQGSVVEHCGSAASYRRQTMVVPFVAVDPLGADGTNLRLAGLYSDREDLVAEFLEYRLDRLAQQATACKQRLLGGKDQGLDLAEARALLEQLRGECDHMHRSLNSVQLA